MIDSENDHLGGTIPDPALTTGFHPGFRPLLEAALTYAGGSHTLADVERMIADGEAQFWPGVHSCIVTEIAVEPQRKVLHFFLVAGNLTEVEAMEPLILRWGAEKGCTLARCVGRRGWERTFMTAKSGWKNTNVIVMEKPIHGKG